MSSKKTPLYQSCLDLDSRMVEFAGWTMPIQFTSLTKEHHAVRNHSGLFDISHMGVFQITGNNPKDALQKLVPSDLHRIGSGEACYTVLLNNNAGIIDDLIIYDLGTDNDQERLLLVLNAACAEADLKWLKQKLSQQGLTISDAKNSGVLLALQGPESTHQLKRVLGNAFKEIPRFGHCTMSIKLNSNKKMESIFIARTGYTGEDGYEILLSKEAGITLWSDLINNGVTPCGLGARDTLRLEAAMPLHGNDITQATTPLEAGLGWLVHLEKPEDFIGKAFLTKQSEEGIKKKLVGLSLLGKAVARKGYELIANNKKIGEITSGGWSPTLNISIALAYVPIELAKPGTKLKIKIRDKLHEITVTKKPFYRRIS